MARLSLLSAFLLLVFEICSAQEPDTNSEAARLSLHGPVHTVLSEQFDFAGNPKGILTGAAMSTFDPQGYQVEEFRYAADGSLKSHTKLTRKAWQIFKIETTSVVPEENEVIIHSFDSQGVITQTERYDQNGAVTKTTNEPLPKVENLTGGYRSRQETPDGKFTEFETSSTNDRASGLSRYATIVDGTATSSSLVQRDFNGARKLTVHASPDGSFTEIERRPDGTSVRHSYLAAFRTDNYATIDRKNRLVEGIQESQSDYYRTKFRYDGAGRRIEMARYDRAGRLLSKDTTEYREDTHGNWIEQKESQWVGASRSQPAQSMLVSVNLRTITYY